MKDKDEERFINLEYTQSIRCEREYSELIVESVKFKRGFSQTQSVVQKLPHEVNEEDLYSK